jgi:hypothetical protein
MAWALAVDSCGLCNLKLKTSARMQSLGPAEPQPDSIRAMILAPGAAGRAVWQPNENGGP